MTITRRTLLRGLAAAAAVTALTPTPAFAAGRKWHPGHYFWPSQNRWSPDVQASQFLALDKVGTNPYIAGIKIGFSWADLEGAPGDYTRGFRIVDAYLRKLDSLPTDKYLMVHVNERAFGNPGGGVVPSYVPAVSRPAGETWSGNLAVAARMWEPAVMDRLIALSRVFAVRYNSHPRFEQFSLGETALGVPAAHGFSTEAWRAQLKRWFTESKKVWTATYLRLNANFIGNDAAMRDLITHCVDTTTPGGVTVGGPDPELPLPSITRFITANRVFRGHDGGADLRGKVAWTGEVQAMGLGTRFTQTPREIFDYHYDTMRASHLVWLHNTWTGGTPQRWATGILPLINSVSGRSHTSRPTIGA
ncbi:hypothetical protein [Actinophytocola sp.]|uniref:hypothetical protein n=1 Tax=Actinophytocola sp. TaxID=1872138 RepID=UPI002ED58C01